MLYFPNFLCTFLASIFNGWLQGLISIGVQSRISQFIALLTHDHQQWRNTLVKSIPCGNGIVQQVVNHSLVLFKEDTSPINTYIKLVTASSCYFCFPAGKSLDENQQHHKQPAKEVLLHAYVCMHSCMRVCVCKCTFNHWADHCVHQERAWAHYLIKIPFFPHQNHMDLICMWLYIPCPGCFCNSSRGKEFLSFCIDD